ncbi:MAG: hypothetical protein JRG90_04415 [Deltaproteobacteria bacterium]|nr:hypothetical protein [Deltaproteobacteria bacterium]MBW2667725.1 hypothetical protein [Deltaproteobacteria bacterium]
MKSLRPVVVVLTGAITGLLFFQTVAAGSQGKGGKGGDAAVGIDSIQLINPTVPARDITAEIGGGGFLGGEFVEVTLDGALLDHSVISAEMIIATIPGSTAAGDHEIAVRAGDENKQSASATIRLGGEMIVSCISWFVSGPADEHLHTEVHVEDENGDAVIGATVTWEAGNVDGVYQTNVSATNDNDGHASELTTCPLDENGEPAVSGSGVTDWFCCIGAGKWDNEVPPGKRACPAGEYTARVLDVTPPAFTNMTWDEKHSELEASTELVDPKFP